MRIFHNNFIGNIVVIICVLLFTACSDPNLDASNAEPFVAAKAEAGAIQLSSVGANVQLDGDASEGSNIKFHWTLRNQPTGSVARLENFETNNPTLALDQPGNYIAQLIVMDSANGTSKDFVALNTTDGTSFLETRSLTAHAGLTRSCVACHNGVDATGKSETHINSTNECIVCHSAAAWIPTLKIDHNENIGVCSSCHNGVNVVGKTTLHIETSAECNQCHIAGTSFGLIPSPSVFTVTEDDTEEVDSDNDHPMIGDMMCIDCHNNIVEAGKPSDHILTTDHCAACHSTNDWEPVVTVDHTEVVGVCSSCHNNMIAQGKPGNHIATTSECNVCHSTAQWTPTGSGGGSPVAPTPAPATPTVDHSGFTQATVCMDCHDGTTATGKPVGHVVTSSDCDVCHTTAAWISSTPGTTDHSTFTAATVCMGCHNGTTAIGKPPGHIVTTDDCDVCHSVATFLGTALGPVDHSGFTLDTVCMDCHNGTIATGKPLDHIATASDCDACHNAANWD